MSGITEQSKTGTRLASKHKNEYSFNAKEAYSKDSIVSVTQNGTEKSLLDSSKFLLRSVSIEDEINRKWDSFADSTNKSKNRNMKDWTVNKLWVKSVGLLGRGMELKPLHACWECMVQPEQ
eukprot:10002243-Ditylum_brightwellii.AAC.1